jgi:hypothetical protein
MAAAMETTVSNPVTRESRPFFRILLAPHSCPTRDTPIYGGMTRAAPLCDHPKPYGLVKG